MGFFNSIWNGVKSAFGSKNSAGVSGFANKAKNLISTGLSALNSKTGKSLIGVASRFIPGIDDGVKSLKKYGHQAQNLMNGGAEQMAERYIKKSPMLQQMDRWGAPTKPSKFHVQEQREGRNRQTPTIEKRRRQPSPESESDSDNEESGLSSMFN